MVMYDIKRFKRRGDFAVGNVIYYSYFCTSRNPGRMQSFTKSNIVASWSINVVGVNFSTGKCVSLLI